MIYRDYLAANRLVPFNHLMGPEEETRMVKVDERRASFFGKEGSFCTGRHAEQSCSLDHSGGV